MPHSDILLFTNVNLSEKRSLPLASFLRAEAAPSAFLRGWFSNRIVFAIRSESGQRRPTIYSTCDHIPQGHFCVFTRLSSSDETCFTYESLSTFLVGFILSLKHRRCLSFAWKLVCCVRADIKRRENLSRILLNKLFFAVAKYPHSAIYGNIKWKDTELSHLHVNCREFKFHFNSVLF